MGAITKTRPNWQRLFAQPEAPARYGTEASRKFIEEKIQQQEEAAALMPYSAYISEVTVLDPDGNAELQIKNQEGVTDTASCALFDFIGPEGAKLAYYFSETTMYDIHVRWFGFDIRDLMHIAAADVLASNAQLSPDARTKVPICTWHYPAFTQAPFADPYEVLVPSGMRKQFDVLALCQVLGIEIPITFSTDSRVKADLARQLALRGQFWSLPVDKI